MYSFPSVSVTKGEWIKKKYKSENEHKNMYVLQLKHMKKYVIQKGPLKQPPPLP